MIPTRAQMCLYQGSIHPSAWKGVFSEVRCSNLRAPQRCGAEHLSKAVNHGCHAPNVATNRARKRSKVLRLATLDFVENFSSAPLELFLLWLLSHTKPQSRGG